MVRVLAAHFTEVRSADPLAFAATFAILIVTALLATWIPLYKAASMDPMFTLR